MFNRKKYLIDKGAIPKKDLVHGTWYKGQCRNSPVAIWDENKHVFYYIRHKIDFFIEKINHFEDDNGTDLFFPFERF